jgi:hypothetical protein
MLLSDVATYPTVAPDLSRDAHVTKPRDPGLPIMRWIPLVALLSTSVVEANPTPIRKLATTSYTFDVKAIYANITAFRVVANTPVLTAQINARIASTAGILTAAQTTDMSRDITCEEGVLTDAFVSWRCSGIVHGDGGGTAMTTDAAAYVIENGELRLATRERIFVADFAARMKAFTGKSRLGDACAPDAKMAIFIASDGVSFDEAEESCTIAWEVMFPLLRRDSILRRIIADGNIADTVDEPVEHPRVLWAKAQPRFVVDPTKPDVVIDRATDLMWAVRDNGADIDHAGALAFAAASTIGAYDDWRLPTDDELAELSDPSMAHRSKTDCTKGKNALLVTPSIRLSCGLAWSSATSHPTKRPIAFGFISGTPRVAKPTEKKNYRALVVRDTPTPGASAR